ncbi:hypothetical protein ACVWZB_004753 [Paenibacillus polymyxa]
MAIIAFWSPDHGRGNTANAVAVGTMMGLDYDIRTLIAQTQSNRTNLETVFMKAKEVQFRNLINPVSSGIDNLERLVKSRRLSAESISNNAISLESGRLDLLKGTQKKVDSEEYPAIAAAIFSEAKRYYQSIVLDLHSGHKDGVTKQLVKEADLVVVNLSQDRFLLERFIRQEDWPEELENKRKIILIGQYDKNSKYNLSNIKRNFKVQDPLFGLSYCPGYRDAFNDMDVLNWFRRTRNAGKNHPSYLFFQELRKVTKELLVQIGVNTDIKRIEKGVS